MTALSARPSISPEQKICCRQIVGADVPAVAALLARGFPSRSRPILGARITFSWAGWNLRPACLNTDIFWRAKDA